MTLFEGSGSSNGDVLSDRACTASVKGESFRERRNKRKTPSVSFSGSEKSAKRVPASASLVIHMRQNSVSGFMNGSSARAAPPEV
jgi:hypothetical protein